MTDHRSNPKPDWLKIRIQSGPRQQEVNRLLRSLSLNTVCGEAGCPNLMECFNRGTAAFMILGRQCTRNCTFCCVQKGQPQPVDEDEPEHLASAVQALGLRHVVITSVTRDDLADGGAGHFARVVASIREQNPEVVIEVLIPDFQGDPAALDTVLRSRPDILNHNMETVPRLYPEVRPEAHFERSLHLLSMAAQHAEDFGLHTKSGIMVGLGETVDEVHALMRVLRVVHCDMLTIGQYLAPTKYHHPVVEYVHPDQFEKYRQTAEELGFLHVASGPLVRSSYLADQATDKLWRHPKSRI